MPRVQVSWPCPWPVLVAVLCAAWGPGCYGGGSTLSAFTQAAAQRKSLAVGVRLLNTHPTAARHTGTGTRVQLVRRPGHQARSLTRGNLLDYWNATYAHWDLEKYARVEQELSEQGSLESIPLTDEEIIQMHNLLRRHTKVVSAPGWSPEVDRCLPTCRLHGTCNQEFGRCDCPRGQQGPDCSQPVATTCEDYCIHPQECRRLLKEACVNGCNSRGTCVSGVCHCYPGYFGGDCSLSYDYTSKRVLLLDGLGYSLHPRGPRIFFYEFPPQYNLWTLTWLDRPLNVLLWERFMSLGLRVADPDEADYFFIPGCGRGCNKWDDKMAWIMKHYGKYWARHGGADHLWTHTGDWGRCEAPHSSKDTRAMLANMTQLAHWGMTVDRSEEFKHPNLQDCFTPDRDILMPSINSDMMGAYAAYNPWHPRNRARRMHKRHLAFLSGGVCAWRDASGPPCPSRAYSLGVREALFTHLEGAEGFLIAKSVPDMAYEMASSEFCFAPIGAGFGKRNVMAAALGCIPVLVNDHVAQPWEPFLDWNALGVWIPEAAINETEAVLRGFTREQRQAKMLHLACAVRHLVYTTAYGGLFEGDSGEFDAVNTLVEVVRARRRHPGTPDARLQEVDREFADFMACRPRSPMPPQPLAQDLFLQPRTKAKAQTSSSKDKRADGASSGDADPALAPALRAYPSRTVATAAWQRAASTSARQLCLYNGNVTLFGLPGVPEAGVPPDPGHCMPRHAYRPAGFNPGGSVLCPVGGPITRCGRYP